MNSDHKCRYHLECTSSVETIHEDDTGYDEAFIATCKICGKEYSVVREVSMVCLDEEEEL